MKKLLGLLAAFGLTASAGSAVVACGDTSKAEDVKVMLTISPKGEDKKEDIEKAINALSFTAEGPKEAKVTLSQLAAADKINNDASTKDLAVAAPKVELPASRENTPAFDMEVTVKFTEKALPAQKVDIKDIKIEDVKVGDEDIEAKVQTEIAKLAKDAKKDTDYTITGNTEAEGTIKVEATKDSKLITGSFEITVAAAE
ncbi:lipoprotein [Spiroplasma alleghenense]|uniref:Spiralin-like protein n=1 Tax=Spiroplasma alleghenense TaxID=216931 RepID=A0A345Z3Q2_9MOLU|nr:lipoprotein [Spiroplasma alleghenense]AXK51231.1 hypothetical protein SALLE_v1c05570 [Spiroplasma alleghenense]